MASVAVSFDAKSVRIETNVKIRVSLLTTTLFALASVCCLHGVGIAGESILKALVFEELGIFILLSLMDLNPKPKQDDSTDYIYIASTSSQDHLHITFSVSSMLGRDMALFCVAFMSAMVGKELTVKSTDSWMIPVWLLSIFYRLCIPVHFLLLEDDIDNLHNFYEIFTVQSSGLAICRKFHLWIYEDSETSEVKENLDKNHDAEAEVCMDEGVIIDDENQLEGDDWEKLNVVQDLQCEYCTHID